MNDTEKVYAILIMLGLWGMVTFFMMIAWVFSEIERFKMMKRRWAAQDPNIILGIPMKIRYTSLQEEVRI